MYEVYSSELLGAPNSNFLHANHASLIRFSCLKSSFVHAYIIDWGIYDFVVCQRSRAEPAFPARLLDKIY